MKNNNQLGDVQLGLGLLAVGRPWGTNASEPSEDEATALFNEAVSLGITFFDTAPAYGISELRFGNFLKNSVNTDRLFVATKAGEVWDPHTRQSLVSHSFDFLQRSIERSFSTLGKIDLLQLHKSTTENVVAKDTKKAFRFAESLGIREFGASVSDLETGMIAATCGYYRYLQFPFLLFCRS